MQLASSLGTLAILSSCSSLVLAQAGGRFQSPLRISVPNPVAVSAGDLDGDHHPDLAIVSGTSTVTLLFQSPRGPLHWRSASIPDVGKGSFFVRSVDLDLDGDQDLLLADPSTTGLLLKGRGDGTFESPIVFTQAGGSRWMTLGDYNADGTLDLASANLTGTAAVFLGQGDARFAFLQSYTGFPLNRPHSIESLDYDRDGKLDLMPGIGDFGARPLKGRGDGRFDFRPDIQNLGCAHFVLTADFNKDGAGDLVTGCDISGSTYVGISLQNGVYQRTLEVSPGSRAKSFEVVDFNKDQAPDLAVVAFGRVTLQVYPGKGDGRFAAPLEFWPSGKSSVYLYATDLDGDGNQEMISADADSSALTIFTGRNGERFLESGQEVSGFAAAKAMAIADLDGQGLPDLFFPSSSQAQVLLFSGGGSTEAPSLTINTSNRYTSLEVVDLDGDGVPDLAGSNATEGSALVALLDADGKARGQLALPAGVLAGPIGVARIDEGDTLDLAVPCAGSNWVAVFLGRGGGAFADARDVPTIEKPRDLALGDLDGDGRTDLAVISITGLAVHRGTGGGAFSEPVPLIQQAARNFSHVAISELDGDGLPDLLVADRGSASVLLLHGKAGGAFDAPVPLKVAADPISLVVGDLDRDGFPDLTTTGFSSQSASVIQNTRAQTFDEHVDYQLGFSPLGHRLADLDRDGALELVAFQSSLGIVLRGRPLPAPRERFRRGDSDGDTRIELNDPIGVLNRLFLGADPLPCDDAADANDDGQVNLADPIYVLTWLFLGGDAPPAPAACGEDPTRDDLPECSPSC